ncbi:ORFL140C [Human betaherpesvirus 5]|nr:ORFL140C [Human betaherpesvirus 5]QHX40465.1 ORFL140C [Human betaherpesvirus 5]
MSSHSRHTVLVWFLVKKAGTGHR